MIGGEHNEELYYTSLRMSGKENILTRGDLMQFYTKFIYVYNEIDAASEVS